jgi:hypothetical protein
MKLVLLEYTEGIKQRDSMFLQVKQWNGPNGEKELVTEWLEKQRTLWDYPKGDWGVAQPAGRKMPFLQLKVVIWKTKGGDGFGKVEYAHARFTTLPNEV